LASLILFGDNLRIIALCIISVNIRKEEFPAFKQRPLTLVAAVDFRQDKASHHFDIISINRGEYHLNFYNVPVNKKHVINPQGGTIHFCILMHDTVNFKKGETLDNSSLPITGQI